MPNPVLHTLAARYARSNAGRTGLAARDFIRDYEDLLADAEAAQGDARQCAERDLLDAERDGLLQVERHRRTGKPQRVRFSAANEARLFAKVGFSAPSDQRRALAAVFQEAAQSALSVPEPHRPGWLAFCEERAAAALSGASLQPLDRENPGEIREILALLPRLLAWQGESLMRFASSVLCSNSKRLEQLRAKLEGCLSEITRHEAIGRAIDTLADLGITENERSCLLHGPLLLEFDGGTLDLSLLTAAARVDRRDIERARFQTNATRCLTVENAAVLHELCNLRTGTILASSGSEGGYANSATIALLKRLPPEVECWHFGDSDPNGFDILRHLREELRPAGREIRGLHLTFRDDPKSRPLEKKELTLITSLLASEHLTEPEKQELRNLRAAARIGRFEQESLGRPGAGWPFYG